ncbi:replication protein RepO, partial [Yersinia enterocolitica]
MSQHFYDGRRWVYNSLSGWAEQFPFWSESTLKRAIANLEKQKLVISGNYNRDSRDRTKWYTINYALLNEIESKQKRMTNASGQNDPMENVKLAQCTLG